MINYDQQPRTTINAEVGLNAFLTRMFGWMATAVLISAVTSYLMMSQLSVVAHLSGGSLWIPLIIWGIFPFIISGQSMKRPTVALVGLFVYAAITGAVMSTYSLVYSQQTMAGAFVASAAVFVSMAAFGLFTKRDLTRAGTQATAAMIGLLVALVINLFLKSDMVMIVFSFIAVIIFSVLTAWDTQRMQKMYLKYGDQVSTTGLAVNGALQLYLDFVNLFLYMLRIFGLFGNND